MKYFQKLLSYMAPPVVAVFLAGLFWKRASATGAFVGLLAGLVIGVGLLVGIDYTPLAHVNFLYVAPIVMAATLVVVVLTSLMTAAPRPEQVAKYVWDLSVFEKETQELKGVPWFKNYRVLSVLLLVIMGIFIYVWR